MKKLIASALSLVALFAISSCSSNGDEDIITQYGDEIWMGLNMSEVQYLHNLADGSESVSFKRVSFDFYQRVGDEKKWTKENFYDWCGLSVPGPGVININEGRSWTPLNMFNLTSGPHPLSLPLQVYRKETGFNKNFYVATPVTLDSEKGTIVIDNTVFEVLEAGSEGLELRCIEPFLTSNLTPGEDRFDIKYVATTPSYPSPDNILYYESSREAYLAIIEMLRAQFGSEFDINPYLYPDIILDDPIVNLDKIEEIVLAYPNW